MLVCRHLCLFFECARPVRKKNSYDFETEKISLVPNYWTWFSRSLLHSTAFVYIFWNVDTTMLKLACFYPQNTQLASYMKPHSHSSLPRPSLWMGWCNHSLEGFFCFLYSCIFYFFLLSVKLVLATAILIFML